MENLEGRKALIINNKQVYKTYKSFADDIGHPNSVCSGSDCWACYSNKCEPILNSIVDIIMQKMDNSKSTGDIIYLIKNRDGKEFLVTRQAFEVLTEDGDSLYDSNNDKVCKNCGFIIKKEYTNAYVNNWCPSCGVGIKEKS